MTDTSKELTLTRLIDATPDKVYRAWTDPELLKQWFAPKPWSTPRVTLDLRPGGANLVVMADEAGNEYPNPGQYLEIVPNERIVTTDAYTGDFQPSGKPFMTLVLTFVPEGSKTRYTATVRHWSEEDRAQHEAMGFHEGWGRCADQMEAVIATV